MGRLSSLLPLLFSALTVSAAQTGSDSDALPRRGYFGVGLEKAESGVRVFAVTPDSTASAAGIEIGDVIHAIDGAGVLSPEAVVAAIGKHKGGESIRIDIAGSAGRQTITATLKPYPTEQMANSSVQYSSVTSVPGARLRTIISIPSQPKGGRFPAVLLIPGGGCASIDTPMSTNIGQPALMHAIGSRGFVTMRVEKSGVGDSEGQPCASIGYHEELAGYRAALSSLQKHPAVDPQQIYLVGISLGGVFAPILASEISVAGISVYGTGAEPPPPYAGRSDRFFQEFASVDVIGAWAKVSGRVQVLHGEYDDNAYVNSASHERISNAVRSSGKASVQDREFPGLDHCWTRHASLEASKDKCGQGEPTTVFEDAVIAFLKSRG
jgi:dienelactone hydrolase